MSNNADTVQLVVTPPGPFGSTLIRRMGARTTYGVLIEIVTQADRSLFLSTPFIFISSDTAVGPLAMALNQAVERSVRIDIVSTLESIDRLKTALPSLVAHHSVSLLRPKVELMDSMLGSHAKIFIADEDYGYIGSANLTDPGLMNNLEMGVMVRGTIARAAFGFWKELEKLGFLERVEK